MDVSEFIKLSGPEVRKDSNLLAIYVDLYEKQFGYKPSCSGCSVNSEFNKLKRSLLNDNHKPVNETIMEKTFQLRQVKGEILTYKNEGKTVRQYDNRMTEEFAINYLTFGTPEQIEERKKLFKKLPKSIVKPEVKKEETEVAEKPLKATKRTKK